MDKADKERLYDRISEEEDMTDAEKREAYYAEIENGQAYEDWKEGF